MVVNDGSYDREDAAGTDWCLTKASPARVWRGEERQRRLDRIQADQRILDEGSAWLHIRQVKRKDD